ncbi:hypothetical protein B0J13DRAFT_676227 [Dactylonectria estremocensis]|uniref:Uncharacterized protein n=1 Tax=Dactylonectria estremocensis TaxID=1079267 RepID=A0A9P9EQF3_9HYPO|nr:hypothetical protein B0J13DRAFT_676227 [Dactylonectria estremocensis]
MDAATFTTVLHHHHPSLVLPVSVPVPVPQPRAQADANARPRSHAPHTHAATDHVHANANINAHSLDAVGNAWHFPDADAMPVCDDTEGHESDVSRLQGDESARSSSVTTPDLPTSRLPPPPPLGYKHDQMVDSNLVKAHLPPPPPDYFEHRQHDAPNVSSFPPPPPNSVVPRYQLLHPNLPPPPPPLRSPTMTRLAPVKPCAQPFLHHRLLHLPDPVSRSTQKIEIMMKNIRDNLKDGLPSRKDPSLW